MASATRARSKIEAVARRYAGCERLMSFLACNGQKGALWRGTTTPLDTAFAKVLQLYFTRHLRHDSSRATILHVRFVLFATTIHTAYTAAQHVATRQWATSLRPCRLPS